MWNEGQMMAGMNFLRKLSLPSALLSLLLFIIILWLWARSLGHSEGFWFADGRIVDGESRRCMIDLTSCNGGIGWHVTLNRATGRNRSNTPFAATCPLKAAFSVEARAETVPRAYPGTGMGNFPRS